jgi:hypothetical protein
MHDPSFPGNKKCTLCPAGTFSTSSGNMIRIAFSILLLGVDSDFEFCCKCNCLKNGMLLAHEEHISVTVCCELVYIRHKKDGVILLTLARIFLSKIS